MTDETKWQQVSEPATPAETDGERIARGWLHSGEPMAGLARRIDEDRATLACATHRACERTPGDCCTIGSVIGYWDKQYAAETQRAEETEETVSQLRRALTEEMAAVAKMREDRWEARKIADALYARERALRTALVATRDHEETDGLCWCEWRQVGGQRQTPLKPHGPGCLQIRAALAGCSLTRPDLPSSIRGLDPDFTTEPAP